MSNNKNSLEDTFKAFEEPSTSRKGLKGQPIIVRLDGQAFHTFTKGLAKPFDKRLSELMLDTTKSLLEKFQAQIGYTQSDEITLIWYVDKDSKNQYPFNGRFQKLESLLAGWASAFFNKNLATKIPEKAQQIPIFDARAFAVPDLQSACNILFWRQKDCTKNAISMAAQAFYPHKELLNKSSEQMLQMLLKKAINFTDYPEFFKNGTFVHKTIVTKTLSETELAKINPKFHPTGPVERSVVEHFHYLITKEKNPIDFFFPNCSTQINTLTENGPSDVPTTDAGVDEYHTARAHACNKSFSEPHSTCAMDSASSSYHKSPKV